MENNSILDVTTEVQLTFYIKSAFHIHTENMHSQVCSRGDKIHCRWVILPII